MTTPNAPSVQHWTEADVPRPPRIDHGSGPFPAHAEFGPLVSRRISNLLTALVALEDTDPLNREPACYAVPLGDGVIAIYTEESVSDNDARAGLVGWVQQVDAGAWSFAGYVREARKKRARS